MKKLLQWSFVLLLLVTSFSFDAKLVSAMDDVLETTFSLSEQNHLQIVSNDLEWMKSIATAEGVIEFIKDDTVISSYSGDLLENVDNILILNVEHIKTRVSDGEYLIKFSHPNYEDKNVVLNFAFSSNDNYQFVVSELVNGDLLIAGDTNLLSSVDTISLDQHLQNIIYSKYQQFTYVDDGIIIKNEVLESFEYGNGEIKIEFNIGEQNIKLTGIITTSTDYLPIESDNFTFVQIENGDVLITGDDAFINAIESVNIKSDISRDELIIDGNNIIITKQIIDSKYISNDNYYIMLRAKNYRRVIGWINITNGYQPVDCDIVVEQNTDGDLIIQSDSNYINNIVQIDYKREDDLTINTIHTAYDDVIIDGDKYIIRNNILTNRNLTNGNYQFNIISTGYVDKNVSIVLDKLFEKAPNFTNYQNANGDYVIEASVDLLNDLEALIFYDLIESTTVILSKYQFENYIGDQKITIPFSDLAQLKLSKGQGYLTLYTNKFGKINSSYEIHTIQKPVDHHVEISQNENGDIIIKSLQSYLDELQYIKIASEKFYEYNHGYQVKDGYAIISNDLLKSSNIKDGLNKVNLAHPEYSDYSVKLKIKLLLNKAPKMTVNYLGNGDIEVMTSAEYNSQISYFALVSNNDYYDMIDQYIIIDNDKLIIKESVLSDLSIKSGQYQLKIYANDYDDAQCNIEVKTNLMKPENITVEYTDLGIELKASSDYLAKIDTIKLKSNTSKYELEYDHSNGALVISQNDLVKQGIVSGNYKLIINSKGYESFESNQFKVTNGAKYTPKYSVKYIGDLGIVIESADEQFIANINNIVISNDINFTRLTEGFIYEKNRLIINNEFIKKISLASDVYDVVAFAANYENNSYSKKITIPNLLKEITKNDVSYTFEGDYMIISASDKEWLSSVSSISLSRIGSNFYYTTIDFSTMKYFVEYDLQKEVIKIKSDILNIIEENSAIYLGAPGYKLYGTKKGQIPFDYRSPFRERLSQSPTVTYGENHEIIINHDNQKWLENINVIALNGIEEDSFSLFLPIDTIVKDSKVVLDQKYFKQYGVAEGDYYLGVASKDFYGFPLDKITIKYKEEVLPPNPDVKPINPDNNNGGSIVDGFKPIPSVKPNNNINDVGVIVSGNNMHISSNLGGSSNNVILPSTDIIKMIEKENNNQVILNVSGILSSSINDIKIKNDVFDALSTNNKDIVINLNDENGKTYATWQFKAAELTNLDNDLNLHVIVHNADDHNKHSTLSKKAQSDLASRGALVLTFTHSGALPGRAQVTVNTNSKFNNGDKLHFYYYNPNNDTYELMSNDIKLSNDMATVEIEHCSSYFLVNEEIIEDKAVVTPTPDINEVIVDEVDKTPSYDWIWILVAGVVVAILAYLGFRKVKKS